MSHSLFFFPRVKSIEQARAECKKLGIDLDGGMSFSEVIGQGPSGEPGYIVSRNDIHVGYYHDRQVWRNEDVCWVGCEISSRPGPSEFARDELIEGHYVKLGDGNMWMIPVARQFPQGTRLPKTLRLGSGGIEQTVAPDYVALWDRACQVASIILGQADDADVTAESMFRLAFDVLRVNYRISLPEVNAMGLFTDVALRNVLQAMIDVPTMLEYAKKKELTEHG